MVAIGFIFLAVILWGGILAFQGRVSDTPLFLKALIAIQPLGFLATILGWVTAEMGRQPWTVYGLLRTSDSVSPIAAGNVLWSICMFIIFFMVIGTSYFYFTLKTLRSGPDMKSLIPNPHVPLDMISIEDEIADREVN